MALSPLNENANDEPKPETRLDLSVLVISFNTREFTLDCLRSLYAQTHGPSFEVIVVDNDSQDGSADAIACEFPESRLFALKENIGFARANNLAAENANGRYLLLLNPDTIVLDSAVTKLLEFGEQHPAAGIYGGRTFDGDGKLDPASCWAEMTPWSFFCLGVGLTTLFPGSATFNPESYGSWKRDDVRNVAVVTGCFFLIERRVWEQLGGFDRRFFMYGEEVDLCLRAAEAGYRPLFCPTAEIIHFGGKSENFRADKVVRLMAARALLVEVHWQAHWHAFGRFMQVAWVLRRMAGWAVLAALGKPHARDHYATFRETWRRRAEWFRPDEVPATKRTSHED